MTKKPETGLQRRIKKALMSEFGGFWFKVHGGPFQQSGIPDLVGCVCGLFFALEVKTPTGRIDDLQEETIRRINEQGGGHSAVVITPQEAVDFVARALRKAGRVPEADRGSSRKGEDVRDFLRTRLGENLDNAGRRRANPKR